MLVLVLFCGDISKTVLSRQKRDSSDDSIHIKKKKKKKKTQKF